MHFAGYAKHIGFYPVPSAVEAFKEEFKPHKSGKGSAQFPPGRPLPTDLIRSSSASFGTRSVPEPLGIRAADKMTFGQIHDEIRDTEQETDERLGALSGLTWVVRSIPRFLFKAFIRLASRNVHMAQRHGVITVTAVGMFGPRPMWLIPLRASTPAVSVGSIVGRVVAVHGHLEEREHLCLTISFDHDIIDGAPAARFTKRLTELVAGGEAPHDEAVQARPVSMAMDGS